MDYRGYTISGEHDHRLGPRPWRGTSVNDRGDSGNKRDKWFLHALGEACGTFLSCISVCSMPGSKPVQHWLA